MPCNQKPLKRYP